MTAGNYTFVVPKNVYVIHAYGAGGGEGGGAGDTNDISNNSNPAGRGVVPMFASLDVTPGEVLNVSVGTGGAGVGYLSAKNPGNDTDIRRGVIDVVRFPGAGRYSWTTQTSAGVLPDSIGGGGTINGTSGENSMHATGGSGAAGSGANRGGGGGGAGYGDGGAGGAPFVNGSPGGISAGGGGGGDGASSGGNGGNGFLFIWY